MHQSLTFLLFLAFGRGPIDSSESITRDGYTLVFCNRQPDFDTTTRRRMIEAFFTVYPAEARRFNRHTARKVVFLIDPTYDGVAATSGDSTYYNPQWFKSHPEDIDVVTHEVMHIVQAYRYPVPGWLTEGIADYARYVYGVNNEAGRWKLPAFKAGARYTDAYKVTARFLVWLEKNGHPGIVVRLDKAARAGTYSAALWTRLTGKTVDELWDDYSRDPAI
jgi:hypothetical protein